MSTDQQNTADTNTARHAERVKPNVTTSETIQAMYAAPAPQETEEVNNDPAQNSNDGGKEGKRKGKPFQERISEVVQQRRDAESRAERAEREATELRAKVEALSARAEPTKEEPRPSRASFATDDDYIEAMADWKANQALAKREQEHAAAQAKAHQEQLADNWKRNQDRAKAEIDDYADVIGKSEVMLPGHIHQAILESEVGPHLAYFFAKHPDEAKRFAAMSATTALRQLGKLEDKLLDDDEPTQKPAPAIEKSKAPPPITPVKDGRALDPGPAKSFDEYRARRRAEQR